MRPHLMKTANRSSIAQKQNQIVKSVGKQVPGLSEGLSLLSRMRRKKTWQKVISLHVP